MDTYLYFANRIEQGSIAAVVHSGIGNVAAGSAFAALQSAGAGGACAAAVNSAVGAATIAPATGVFAWAYSKVVNGTA